MYSNFKQQAIEYVKQAVQEDNAGNYAKAFPLYMSALEYFKTHLKYEKNPEIKEAIFHKLTEYLRRAEEIRFVLDGRLGSASSGDVVVAMKLETNRENCRERGGEGDEEDHEVMSKLRTGSNSAIVREKPNNVAENEKKNIYSNFKEQAIEYVKQAVQEDNAGNYAKAFPLYMNALENFKTHLKYEKNPKIREVVSQKFTEYLRRAKEIRFVLDDGWQGSTSSGDAIVAMRPEMKPENGGEKGGEGDGDDPEQSKLRAGSNSAIVREKPNNVAENEKKIYNNFKEQAIEYVKQAVQEDNAGNYAKAFPLYMNALEYFKAHLKYEENPKIKEAISQKFTEYLRRAEEIRFVLDDGWSGSAYSGDVVVPMMPETKLENGGERGGEGYGEDPEQSKLRAGSNSTILREKPNNVDENEKKKMYSNSKEQLIEYVKQAVQEDNAGNYAKAFPLYMAALEYFKTHLKYEKNPKIKEAISQKYTEYLRRAEEIRLMLNDGWSGSASSGDDVVAMRSKTKTMNDGEGDGEDHAQIKLRADLNSPIEKEKPNVKVAEKPRTAMGRCWPCKSKQRTRFRS